MAIIYSYPRNTNILATDIIVGSTTVVVNGKQKNQTKNFEIGDLATYFNSVIAPPGSYVPYTGAIASVNLGANDIFTVGGARLAHDGNVYGTSFKFIGLLGSLQSTAQSNVVWDLPDQTGTIALVSDITAATTLNAVLTNDNVSQIDAKVGGIYLYNTHTGSGNGYVYITGDKNKFNFYNNANVLYAKINQNSLSFVDFINNTLEFVIAKPTTITNNRIATFQDATGTVAYLSNITGINSGTNTGDNATNSQYSGLVSNATHTGDATGATVLTLATVNANVGLFGSSIVVPVFTVNAKGLITEVVNTAIPTSSGSTVGLLSATDWTTFNNKQSTITNPITGTGTTNYVAKFTSGTVVENSLIFDNGTNVGIGTTSPSKLLDINGDALVNGLTIGRGGGNILGNTANGVNTLLSNTTGNSNTANGVNALRSNTTGNFNTANGLNALYSNTTGFSNTANGVSALFNNTTGGNNTANGVQALISNTTGNGNTANGFQALFNNTTGNNNTANGVSALAFNTTGTQNTANGYQSLFNNTTGNNNTATGLSALRSNTTGTQNTANGLQALQLNTTGFSNTANGFQALISNTTGFNNTANGLQALQLNTTGASNVGLGFNTQTLNNNNSNSIVIGANAVGLGSNTVVLGNDSIVTTALKGSVGVGTTTPNPSALLEISSSTKGFLPPRMTTTQINAITSPAEGLVVYNTTLGVICFRDASGWRQVFHISM